jgi:RNA polymerase primary sigma factor
MQNKLVLLNVLLYVSDSMKASAQKNTTDQDYIRKIEQFPILSQAQERELSRRIQDDNDDEAKNLLARSNLRLVVAVAQRYQILHPDVSLLDIIQAGNLGLFSAVEKFDYRKGYKFSEYASWWIRQAILRNLGIRDH